jgi:acetolactate synthase-1/2/3 large subunit
MPEDGIVCLDNGMYKIWFARNYRTRVANTLLLDNAHITMAPGLPWSIMTAMLWRRLLIVDKSHTVCPHSTTRGNVSVRLVLG